MAKPRYNADKRRRELAKQKKKQEKKERLQQRKAGEDPDAPVLEGSGEGLAVEGDAPAANGDSGAAPTTDALTDAPPSAEAKEPDSA